MSMSLSLGRGTKRLWPACKPCLLFLLLAAPLLLPVFGMGREALDSSWLREWLQGAGTEGIVRYLALAAMLSVCGMPRQALTALGGYAFGAAAGCLWSTLGLLLGCACSFYLARTLGAETARRRFGPRLAAIDRVISGRPFSATLMLRLFPVGNNALLNLAAGVSHVSARSFFTATAIGYLPQNVAFALLGSGVAVDSPRMLALSAALLAVATALSWRLYLHHHRSGI